MGADRQDIDADQTDRPEEDALPRVRDVLRVDALQRGAPEALVGGEALDARVRWVHVSDSDQVADLLDGGELLLTTAAGWAGADAALHDLADRLAGAGVAGVVIELGTRFTVAPPAFIAACRARGLALIALERVVKFVTVTEAVHRRIISGQLEALQERQRLHELFTGLSLRGAPADVVVRETARVLDAPVVLETPGREVVTAEVRDVRASDVLTGWAARSRSDVELLTVPVQARGVRWGALVALPGAEHPAGALTVLELAATALAFARLADGPTAWEVLPARDLVQAIAGGGHSGDADVAARMAAAGLPVVGRALGVLVVPRAQPGQVQRLVEALTATDARNAGADTRAMGAVHDGDGVVLVSSRRELSSAQISAAAAGLSTGLAIGTPASTVAELLASVRPARLLAARLGPAEVRRVDDRPLTRLVTELGGDHRLQEHSERMLAPLIRFDEQHGGDLLRVLRAVVAHPGSRTAAAASSHLSRSVFYQRLTLISDLLDADLDDGETLAALHLAVLTLPVR
ncbi:PucR family transcriptional regulator [Microbacterium esteraromaticum]|uniref:PucR family transcriptional regulator n=1 Tax=Microbacterium esteraromaticum TaxID=57043 RepID=UPI001CD79320|nr:PucR family transcriptional regulator [Microbacterium esteraromaticum]MCA1308100.1 PucR family transcriptional regulator [Microbacterium esteraromaticum]